MRAGRALLDRLWWVVVLCLVGILAELVGWSQQISVQRGIDAHAVTVSGTFAEFVEGRTKYNDDSYVVTYSYEDRSIRTELRSLPGNPAIGDTVCLEIDATRPDHARVCGTRGGIDDARTGLAIGVGLLAVIAVIIGGVSLVNMPRASDLVAEEVAGLDARAGPTGIDGQYPADLLLRPAAVTRWTMVLVFPGVFVVVALGVLADPTVTYREPLATFLLAPAAVLVARCWRVAIRCSTGTITVRGVLITRRIPAAQVTAVKSDITTSTPVVHWRDPSGRRHRLRLTWFRTGYDALSSVSEHHLAELARLRAWVIAYRTRQSSDQPPAPV
jgi:hypothetical protein